MKNLRSHFLILLALFSSIFSLTAIAQDLQFDNLDQDDVDDIVNDLSGAMTHTSVAGANPLAATIGVEVGLVAGMANTPNIQDLVKDSGSSEDASRLPHGGLLARVGLTSMFVFEALYFPETDFDGTSFQNTSLAAQFNFLSLPFINFALKGHMTNTAIRYSQIADGSEVDVAMDNQVRGVQVLASGSFGLFDPYIGVGKVYANGDVSVSGTTTIFDTAYSSKDSLDSQVESTQFLGGFELDLGFFNLGFESSQSFGNSRHSVKASLEF